MSSTIFASSVSSTSHSSEELVLRVERELQAAHQELLSSLLSLTTAIQSEQHSNTSSGSSPGATAAAAPDTPQSVIHCKALMQSLVESSSNRIRHLQSTFNVLRERLHNHENDGQHSLAVSQNTVSIPQIMSGESPINPDMKPPLSENGAEKGATSLTLHPLSEGGARSPHGSSKSPQDPFALSATFGSKVFLQDASPTMTPQEGSSRHASFSSVRRAGSFARAGSFTRKRQDGVDVVMLQGESASPDVGDAINETFSMASRGSWRRRSTAANALMDVRRRSYLPIVELEGMPALNLDEPGDLRSRFSRKSTRHTAVFRGDGDLESLLDECDLPRIYDINSPEFNLFEEFKSFGDDTFTIVVMNVLLKYNFINILGINVGRLLSFVNQIRKLYRSNPFHNALHAADVVQTTHVYLCQRDVKENFTDVELIALLFSAAIIDLGHLGVSNDFLIKTKHPIAKLYNHSSPLECMHCALAFCVLDDAEYNFFAGSPTWSVAKDVDFRYLVSTFVLNSDSTKHSEILVSVDQLLSQGRINDDQVPQLLAAIIHAADMNYLAKPKHIFIEWATRHMAESFLQGDAEKRYYAQMQGEAEKAKREAISAGDDSPKNAKELVADDEKLFYEISKMCNRELIEPTQLQLSLVEYVVLPYMTILRQVLPNVWFERLQFNHEFLQFGQQVQQPVMRAGSEIRPPPGAVENTSLNEIPTTARPTTAEPPVDGSEENTPQTGALASGSKPSIVADPDEPPIEDATSLECSMVSPNNSTTGGATTNRPVEDFTVATKVFNEGIDRHIQDVGQWQDIDQASDSGFIKILFDWVKVQLVRQNDLQAAVDGLSDQTTSSSAASSNNNLLALAIQLPTSARSAQSGLGDGSTPKGALATSTKTVNAIFMMCSELLKHVYGLVNAFEGAPATISTDVASPVHKKWSPHDEIATFSEKWIKLLRSMEESTGQRLLEQGAMGVVPEQDHTSRSQSPAGAPTTEADETKSAIRLVKAMRDQSAPHPFKSTIESSFNPHAPMGVTVLLTQLWWVVCAALNEQNVAKHGAPPADASPHATSFTTHPHDYKEVDLPPPPITKDTPPMVASTPKPDEKKDMAPLRLATPDSPRAHQQQQALGMIKGVGSLRNIMDTIQRNPSQMAYPADAHGHAIGPFFRREGSSPQRQPQQQQASPAPDAPRIPTVVGGSSSAEKLNKSDGNVADVRPTAQSAPSAQGDNVADTSVMSAPAGSIVQGSPMKYVLNRRRSKK